MSSSDCQGREAVTLEDIDIKGELLGRPHRPPDYEAENRALLDLAGVMTESPHNILQKLVETALELCRADTAGISLIETQNGEPVFRWEALAGVYAAHRNNTMPRNASPCGTTIDRNNTQLMYLPERVFPALRGQPPVVEALLVPFHVGGVPIGTVWVVAHDECRKFDTEDERVVLNLAQFTSATWQLWKATTAAETAERAQRDRTQELARTNDALQMQISERKRADEEIRTLNTELETRVLERTRELVEANRTLARQADELIRTNEELERFAYVSSHDLQEPLRGIISYAKLLARRYTGRLDPEADEFILYMVSEATRMSQLIRDVLLYSRLGQREKKPAPVDCAVLVAQIQRSLGEQITAAQASITHSALPTVLGDSTQIGQVFQNLFANALKFKHAGMCRIHVSAVRNGAFWLFSIQDNGIGIDPLYAEQIFGVFKRLHGREEYPGSGIGLAICKKIIEGHGGRIWVESQLGQGACFYFTLPSVD
jgi:signal transduction histidine kinase